MAVVLLLLSAPTASAVPKTYVGGHLGQWNVDANWSPVGVPAAADDVTIGGLLVEVNNAPAASARSLTLNGGVVRVGGAGNTLDLGPGASTITGDGDLIAQTGGVMTLAGTTTLSGAGAHFTAGDGGLIHNAGTVTVLPGASGSFGVAVGNGTFKNSGDFVFQGGDGNRREMQTNVENTASGRFDVQSGEISICCNLVNPSAGDWTIASGAKLTFRGGSFPLASGASITGAGTFKEEPSVFSTPTVTLPAGTTFSPGATELAGGSVLNLNNELPVTGRLSGSGTRGGSATLNVGPDAATAASQLIGFNFNDSGTTTFAADDPVEVPTGTTATNGSHTLNLLGQTTLSGEGFNPGAGTLIHNQGTITMPPGNPGNSLGSGFGTLRNSGSILYNGGNTKAFNASIHNTAAGTVAVQSGEMQVDFVQAGSPGAWTAANGATLTFRQGQFELGAGASITGAGTFGTLQGAFGSPTVTVPAAATYSPGRTLLAAGTLQLDGTSTSSTLEQVGGNLRGAGTFTVQNLIWSNGQQSGTGTTLLPSGATLSLSGQKTLLRRLRLERNLDWNAAQGSMSVDAPGVLENAATLTFTDDADIAGFGTLRNVAGATLRKNSAGSSSAPQVENAGTVGVTQGILLPASYAQSGGATTITGATLDSGPFYNQSGGTTTVGAAGILDAPATVSGGALAGVGTVVGNVTNSAGTVRPGVSPGTLTVDGNYTQGAGGTLESEIASASSFDRLVVSGSAALNGTLAIQSSHDPGAGETFEILKSTGARSGTFSTVTGDQLSGKRYVVNYNPNDVRLSIALGLPQNTALPTISGNAIDGQTLTCAAGTWTGSPSFGFAWLRDGSPIAGATSPTYTLSAADVGKQIRCRVTATNSGGSAEASSAEVSPAARPVIEQPPPQPAPVSPSAPAASQCGDGRDNDSDGAIDRQDPGCLSPASDTFSRADNNEGDENLRQLTLCGQSNVKLVRADAKGRQVLLSGFVATRLAGQNVDIRATVGGKTKSLASFKPRADGQFNVAVKGPGKRAFKKVRYQAVVAGSGSARLKLPQSLASKSLRQRGATLELRGQVKRSVLGKRKAVIVKRLVCGAVQTVGQARPSRSGAYVVRFSAPGQTAAALYRAEAKVLARPGSRRHVRQFARAIGVGG